MPYGDSWLFTGNMLGYRDNLVPHGQGSLTNIIDGRTVQGIWINGKLSEGTIKSANGNIYRGLITDYLPEGNGLYQEKNGTLYQGEWHKGNILKGTMTDPNSDEVYIGEFKNNLKHGHGELYINSQQVYVGNFERGTIG